MAAPLQILLDPAATRDVLVPTQALPPGALPGDVLAIRPLATSSSTKDRPLLYKVPLPVDESEPQQLQRVRRARPTVVVNPQVAQSFGWLKTRAEVDLQLVRSGSG